MKEALKGVFKNYGLEWTFVHSRECLDILVKMRGTWPIYYSAWLEQWIRDGVPCFSHKDDFTIKIGRLPSAAEEGYEERWIKIRRRVGPKPAYCLY